MKKNLVSPDDDSHDIAPEHIVRLLTHATQQLDDGTVDALHHARKQALARHAASRPVLALDTGHSIHWPVPHSARQWMAAAILLAALAGGISYWHHALEYEASKMDIAILTDDLPMEVFIDR